MPPGHRARSPSQDRSATAEREQMTAERVLAQHLLHLECQRRKASAHVRVACRQPHSRARRNRDHRRTRASRTRRSASPSTSPSTRMRCPLPRSISMMPWLFRRRAAVVVNGTSATSRGGADGPISTGTNGAVLASPCLRKLFAPPEQLAHVKAGHASHLGNTGSGLDRCCNKPFLLILRPPAPPLTDVITSAREIVIALLLGLPLGPAALAFIKQDGLLANVSARLS